MKAAAGEVKGEAVRRWMERDTARERRKRSIERTQAQWKGSDLMEGEEGDSVSKVDG